MPTPSANTTITNPKTGKVHGLGHRIVTTRKLVALTKEAAPIDPAGSSDLTALEDPVFDQGFVSSCEGHSHAQGIGIRLKAKGRPFGSPISPNLLYNLALALQRQGRRQPLFDIGTQTYWLRMALAHWGIVPMGAPVTDPGETQPRWSDCSASSAVAEPNLRKVERASLKLVPGAYGCYSSADSARALSNRIPVEWGGWVDTAFVLASGDEVFERADPLDPDGGYHSMLEVAHASYVPTSKPLSSYPSVSSKTKFLMLNSWGAGWAKLGHLWVSEDFVESGDESTVLEVN